MNKISDRAILASFTAGHVVDDIYMNALPPFLPVLIAASGLTYASAGLLVTAFTLTSSVAQPVLGYAIDRYRVRWIGALGLVWAGIFFGLMGATDSYWIMLMLATLAGVGPAMFHPHALSAVSGISKSARGRIMSVFIIGGNIGFAIGPLLIGAVTSLMGRRGMLLTAIPGILMGIFLWKVSSGMSSYAEKESHPFRLGDLRPAVNLIFVAILRSWVYFSVLSYLPSYFVHTGSSLLKSNSLLSLMLLAGVAGQFTGGTLSDHFGRKNVTMISLLLSAPLLYSFLHTDGAAALAFLFLFGFSVMASFSVTMVMMHEIMHRHIGIASGIMIGFALGIGGMGVMLTGIAADSFGLYSALNLLVAGLVSAGLLSGLLSERQNNVRSD